MYQNIFVSQRTETEESLVYLWGDGKHGDEGLTVLPYKKFAYAYKPDSKGHYTSIYGDKLKKVDWYKWGEPGLFESDLPRETRVLTDLYLEHDDPSVDHRILNFDIEVDSTGGFSTPEEADKAITAIANHNSVTNHYTAFILDPAGVFQNTTVDNETVVPCKSEEDLLVRWLKYYHEMSPTIMTGWNVDGYDIPYLYNRLKRVFDRETAKSLSPIGVVTFNQNRNRFVIAGVSVLDYLLLYKKFTYTQKPSYRLDAIGKDEIGLGKVEFEGTLNNLYKTDIKKFVDYNLRDVQIVQGIDQKMKLIELARFICHMGHVPYEDFGYSSKFIEGTIITYLHRKGIISANKPYVERDAAGNITNKIEDTVGFTGAYVKEPEPGLYEWVYSLDLTSLYPSIIMSLNISPESKCGRVHGFDMELHVKKQIPEYEVQMNNRKTKKMSRDEFMNMLRTEKMSLSSNGILYKQPREKVVGRVIEVL